MYEGLKNATNPSGLSLKIKLGVVVVNVPGESRRGAEQMRAAEECRAVHPHDHRGAAIRLREEIHRQD